MSLSQDLSEAINKNLSAEVGQVLRKELERIPQLEKQLRDAISQMGNCENVINVLQAKVKSDESLTAREKTLAEREKALAERDVKVAIQEAVTKSISEQQVARVSDMKELVTLVFKGPIMRHERTESHTKHVPGSNGYPQTVTDCDTVTTRSVPE